jgi:hypothetical protein
MIRPFEDLEKEQEQRFNRAAALLPAWFVRRMMDDVWSFGLLLITGEVLHVSQIDNVVQAQDGSVWIDALMLNAVPFQAPEGMKNIAAPTSRLGVSINSVPSS